MDSVVDVPQRTSAVKRRRVAPSAAAVVQSGGAGGWGVQYVGQTC